MEQGRQLMTQEGLGVRVRRRLGRWETPAAEAYRAAFINLDDMAATVASVTTARRILEIGCGDGSVADRMCQVFPDAEYVGIDVTPDPGRRYRGAPERAVFRSMYSSELLSESPEPFDLVLVVDVLHHVDDGAREALIGDAMAMTKPGGCVVVKDWERNRSLAHALTYGADRYVSGDKTVRFMTPSELRGLVLGACPDWHLVCEARVPPHRNNLLLVLRKPE